MPNTAVALRIVPRGVGPMAKYWQKADGIGTGFSLLTTFLLDFPLYLRYVEMAYKPMVLA